MNTSIDNEVITRPGFSLRRVINSTKIWDVVKGIKRIRRSHRQIRTENIFRRTLTIVAVSMVVLVLALGLTLVIQSLPSIKALGVGYLWGTKWDAVHDKFGALPFLIGTLLTSFLALIISIPFSFAVAVVLGEYYPKGWVANLLTGIIELIAAVPSVIYGFWGLIVLAPMMQKLEARWGLPNVGGQGIVTSSLILSVMIIPYAASLGRSMILMVPSTLKEAAYGLGATRWEVIRSVVVPYTKSGLFAGILLSLGRALGETMAVTMVIGNSIKIPHSIFDTGNTMASVIANELGDADKAIFNSALIELGLVLFLVTVVINMIGKRVIKRFTN